MIGLVIVSHSAKLAEGVRDLAIQMVKDQVPIAIAAGIEDADDPIGTDPLRVMAAIEAVYSDDGVVVLMDLGSALMSAEMALEFLSPAQQAHIFLCEAPLVEGTIAAAVQAMAGGSLTQVIAEARNALTAKAQQLAPFLPALDVQPTPEIVNAPAAEGHVMNISITNPLGLHARPLAKLIGLLGQYAAEVSATKAARTVNAKSMNKMATLGIKQGDELIFHACGSDALAALTAVKALAAENFGEKPEGERLAGAQSRRLESRTASAADELLGIPAAPGIAIGPVALYQLASPVVREYTVDDPPAEWQRFQQAVQAALAELQAMQARTQQTTGTAEADIFAAHRLLLQDPELQKNIRHQLLTTRRNAEAVWQQAIQTLSANYHQLDDAYLRERRADILDVGQRVLRHLLQIEMPTLHFNHPVILVANELTPSDTAQLDPEQILGIIMAQGGAISHSAILARALGIPAVVGVGQDLKRLTVGQTVAVDGSQGHVWLAPTAEQLRELQIKKQQWWAEQQSLRQTVQLPAITRHGKAIEVAANISDPNEIDSALAFGAEGVGLFRTELFFMARQRAPTEEEQYLIYCTAARKLSGRSLIIRTLDIGGDKPLPYLALPAETNPFLGWRGLRYCLANPQFFKIQLRAILRAGAAYPVKLMLPMVSTVEEVRQAKTLLAQAQAELQQRGVKAAQTIELGLMIEVPAAVLLADQLAQEVDFFSIGTNDLTQYIMAADRGNPQVAGLANALQPAMLRAIRRVVDAAHAAGIWVGMCGELAGNVLATPLLVGLGLDELSMSAPAIPQVKTGIRQADKVYTQQIVDACLALQSAAEIEQWLGTIKSTM